jgi:predicted NBD/HSP70 family sugar kinase
MKDEPIFYVGLDVHQSTTVACVRDEQGGVRIRATVPTEEKAIVRLVGSAGRRVHVAFEEGTQA